MTIDTIINDCEQRVKQSELFIKAHQKNMEIGEIKEYQYYIERDKLTIDTMHKYQKIQEISKISTCGIIEKYKRINGVINDGGEDGSGN